MPELDKVTVVSVNLMTLGLTRAMYESLREFYPDVRVILVDNGSRDKSTDFIREQARIHPHTDCVLSARNLGHGGGLNQAIRKAATRYVFTIDSDCIVKQGSFLELMVQRFEKDPLLFALGSLDHRGTSGIKRGPHPYVHPWASMLDRSKYLKLTPFVNGGAPAMRTMLDAEKHGFHFGSFPVRQYIHHIGGGTRASQAWRRQKAKKAKRK
jgi:glycosyltransferase involved in cell wall biosynthesis